MHKLVYISQMTRIQGCTADLMCHNETSDDPEIVEDIFHFSVHQPHVMAQPDVESETAPQSPS